MLTRPLDGMGSLPTADHRSAPQSLARLNIRKGGIGRYKHHSVSLGTAMKSCRHSKPRLMRQFLSQQDMLDSAHTSALFRRQSNQLRTVPKERAFLVSAVKLPMIDIAISVFDRRIAVLEFSFWRNRLVAVPVEYCIISDCGSLQHISRSRDKQRFPTIRKLNYEHPSGVLACRFTDGDNPCSLHFFVAAVSQHVRRKIFCWQLAIRLTVRIFGFIHCLSLQVKNAFSCTTASIRSAAPITASEDGSGADAGVEGGAPDGWKALLTAWPASG